MNTINTLFLAKRRVLSLPPGLCKRYGFEEGRPLVAEEREDGVLLCPAATVPVRRYSLKKKAAFTLNNAPTKAAYKEARTRVKKMGFDPDAIPHETWK
jgi:bifunctional DNA-binding transcriptional regulator/antitoxin component of YhaV-PrlF toxin-antitoxin module